ncbi:helix-turn-helix domain-containing protein [Acinetobacter baumannii]|nr:helix-turn-helix domain-containing protein [Acinetobacter baumannii]
MSYHHLNFEDRTALMLESRKEGFSARKFAELIKRHPSTIYRELKRNSINDVYQAQYASDECKPYNDLFNDTSITQG